MSEANQTLDSLSLKARTLLNSVNVNLNQVQRPSDVASIHNTKRASMHALLVSRKRDDGLIVSWTTPFTRLVSAVSRSHAMEAKPANDPPHSTEKYDHGALLPEQQKKVNELKVHLWSALL